MVLREETLLKELEVSVRAWLRADTASLNAELHNKVKYALHRLDSLRLEQRYSGKKAYYPRPNIENRT